VNGRMDTLQAAILLAKFELFPDEVEKRRAAGDVYNQLLNKQCPSVKTPAIRPSNTSVYAQYTIEVNNRETVQSKLKELGIPTAVHYPVPLNLQPAFSDLGQDEGSFPVAEQVAKRVISLPMHPYIEVGMQEDVADCIAEVLG